MEKKVLKATAGKRFRGRYVLVTAARNEGKILTRTIASVLKQTVLPVAWIIVNDNSSDNTMEVIQRGCSSTTFIKHETAQKYGKRDFSSKVYALNQGIRLARQYDHEFIGVLDADISLDSDYFQKLLIKFENNPCLGLAGGLVQEIIDGKTVSQAMSLNSVAGAVQFFKKDCFDSIGEFIPIPNGCEDAAAEIRARWSGFAVETFPDLKVLHLKPESGSVVSILRRRFLQGIAHSAIGYHPLFQFLRCMLRISQRPYLGSIMTLFGYCCGSILRIPRVLEPEVVNFLRREQLNRIKDDFKSLVIARGQSSGHFDHTRKL